jgi:phytoene dehydrogenase-like protein
MDKSQILNEKFDAIIIGSGMGGLNAACYLTLEGKKVLILEKNNFIGGRCSSFKKKSYTVDYGIHAFAFGKNGPLHNPIKKATSQGLFKKDILKWKKFSYEIMYNKSFLKIYLPLKVSHFWNYFRTAWSLIRFKLPFKDKKALVKIYFKMKKMPKAKIEALSSESVKDFLDRFTSSRAVHAILMVTSDSYAVWPYDRVAAQDYVEITQEELKGNGISYPVGGCGAIPEAYKRIIEAKGGHIITNQTVENIIIEKNIVKGVKLKQDDREIYSDIVISNVDWKTFYDKLVGPNLFNPELVKKINSIERSLSGIIAHIALDKKLIKKKFVVRASPINSQEILDRYRAGKKVRDVGAFIPIVSNIDPKLAPPGKQLILAAVGGIYEVQVNKDEFIDIILDYLQEIIRNKENIREHVEWIDVVDPKDLNRLFGENGSIIALAQQLGQVRDQRPESRTSIKGLYHCGDDSGKGIFGIGTELAALSGQNCARLILEDEKSLK